MNDQIKPEAARESFSPGESRLLAATFDFSPNSIDQFKAITADLRSSQGLEDVLPTFELYDSSAPAKEVKPVPENPDRARTVGGVELPGDPKHEIPPVPENPDRPRTVGGVDLPGDPKHEIPPVPENPDRPRTVTDTDKVIVADNRFDAKDHKTDTNERDVHDGDHIHVQAEHHEKRGPVHVTVNDSGDVTSVTDKFDNIYAKGPDNKWIAISPDGTVTLDSVTNLTVDKDGNMSYDDNSPTKGHRHVEKRADGTGSVDGDFYGGKVVVDSDNRVTEAPAGDGHIRQYHYTGGHLDQIDGRTGHWDRQHDKDGNPQWVNKDTGALWKGDFTVDNQTGDLTFKRRDGVSWTFTRHGEDVLHEPTKAH